MLQAWLDGHYLGQNVLPTNLELAADHRHRHVRDPGRSPDGRRA